VTSTERVYTPWRVLIGSNKIYENKETQQEVETESFVSKAVKLFMAYLVFKKQATPLMRLYVRSVKSRAVELNFCIEVDSHDRLILQSGNLTSLCYGLSTSAFTTPLAPPPPIMHTRTLNSSLFRMRYPVSSS
jgi:hypothetical protein